MAETTIDAGSPSAAGKPAPGRTQDGRLTVPVLGAFALFTLPAAALGLPITVYLPPFYAEQMGLGLATVGFIFTLARLWDVVTDPIFGYTIDRFPTRWGRRKHWIVFSVPLLMVPAYFIYMPTPGEHSAAYLGIWLLILYIGYTFMVISHQSWGADLTDTYDERSRLYGWREVVLIVGMVTVLALPALIEQTGIGDVYTKIASMGWYLLILLPLTALLLVAIVPDNPNAKPVHLDWRTAISAILQNTGLRRTLVADFCVACGTGITGATYIFLAKWVFDLGGAASLVLLLYFVAGLAAMPIWMKLSYRVGKHQSLMLAMAYSSLTLLTYIPLSSFAGSMLPLIIGTMIYGVAFGAAPMILRAMMADLSDMDELDTGGKRAGLFFALLTTTSKIGGALSVGLSFWILSLIGFDPAAETNSEAAREGLLYTFVFLPTVFFAIAAVACWKYPLDREAHAEIRRQLSAKTAHGGAE